MNFFPERSTINFVFSIVQKKMFALPAQFQMNPMIMPNMSAHASASIKLPYASSRVDAAERAIKWLEEYHKYSCTPPQMDDEDFRKEVDNISSAISGDSQPEPTTKASAMDGMSQEGEEPKAVPASTDIKIHNKKKKLFTKTLAKLAAHYVPVEELEEEIKKAYKNDKVRVLIVEPRKIPPLTIV